MNVLRRILRALLPLLVLSGGVLGLIALVETKPVPQKEPRKDRGVLVSIQSVSAETEPLVVQAQGTVTPSRQVVVQPEVQGRVVWKDKSLVVGGRFKKGDLLLRIDPRQYALQAEQQRSTIDQAEQQLALERARREIAKQEWQIIGEDTSATEEGRAAALREPQLKQAQASLKTAQTAESLAKLNLGRTALRAPFNGMVQATTIDVGQLVSPQSQLATLVGTDTFWVQTSIPVRRLASIRVPGVNAEKDEGSEALVWQDVGGERVERTGKVVRLLGDLDPVGRMARVLVEVEDPLGLGGSKKSEAGKDQGHDAARIPLLVGAYVHVEISAKELVDVIEIPRLALRGGDQVYVRGKDGTLEIRNVGIVWRRDESVLVDSGVQSGDEVVLSRIPSPVEGMKLRVQRTSGRSVAEADESE